MSDSVELNQIRDDLTARMKADMRNTIEQHLGYDERLYESLLDDLVRDGMHPVERLLTDNHQLVDELARSITDAERLRANRMR